MALRLFTLTLIVLMWVVRSRLLMGRWWRGLGEGLIKKAIKKSASLPNRCS